MQQLLEWFEHIRERGEQPGDSQRLGPVLGIGLSVLPFVLASFLAPSPRFDAPLARGAAERALDVVSVDLLRGQALTVRVAQHGVDVEAVLLDPQGHETAAVDSSFGPRGDEVLYAVARQDGRHRLVLRLSRRIHDARYVLTLGRPRPATPRDRRRFEAGRFVRQGVEAKSRGELQQAYAHFQKAIGLLDSSAPELRADAFLQAGKAAEKLKRADQAREWYTAGLEAGGPIERAYLAELLARLEERLGSPESALDVWQSCSRDALLAGDHRLAALALNEMGALHQTASRPWRAADALYRSQAIWPVREDPSGQIRILTNLSNIYRSMGQHRVAEAYISRALAAVDPLTQPEVAVQALSSYVPLAPTLKDAAAAVAKAQAYAPSPGERAVLDLRWGSRLLLAGNLHAARPELEHAVALAQRQGDLGTAWNARALLAHILHQEGRYLEALALLDSALRFYIGRNDLYGIYTVLYGRARVLRDLGRPAEARRGIDHALKIAEALRLEAQHRAARATMQARIQDLYDLSIALHMEAGDWGSAFETGEQARARTLLEGLALRQRGEPRIPRELARRRDDLRSRITETHLRAELARLDGPQVDLRAPDARMGQLFAELLQVEAEIERRADPRGRSLVAGRPLTLAEVQRHLDADTVVLAYSVGEEQSFGWVVSSSEISADRLEPRARLDPLVRDVYQELRSPPRDKKLAPPAIRQVKLSLSHALLAPFAGKIRGKRLVILADGALVHLPFAALPDPDDPSGDTPLIARHDLTQAPSASVAILLNEEAGRHPWPPRSLAAVADSVYDYGDVRLKTRVRGGTVGPRPEVPAARSLGILEIGRLHHAGSEARAIAGLFSSPYQALGFEASRATVTGGRLYPYEAVHFATHGFAHRERPDLSGIVLSLIDPHGRRQDGFLRSFEIHDLRLSASLVVLSGCETGLGEEVEGEGIVGLVRGFFHTGVPRVVASLWQVDDEATSFLMIRFYEGIKRRGLPAPAALRAAQDAVRSEKRWEDPYYWAGFGLQGSWQ